MQFLPGLLSVQRPSQPMISAPSFQKTTTIATKVHDILPVVIGACTYTHIYICILYVCTVSIYLPTYLSTYLPIYLSTYLPTYLPNYLSIYLSISIYIGIHVYVHKYIYIYTYITHVNTLLSVCRDELLQAYTSQAWPGRKANSSKTASLGGSNDHNSKF